MTRKRKQGRVSHDRWLVSYADFITLLFAFFVVLFATGQSDMRKKVELAASIQSAFKQMGIFEAHAKSPPLIDSSGDGGTDETAIKRPLTLPVPGDARVHAVCEAATRTGRATRDRSRRDRAA